MTTGCSASSVVATRMSTSSVGDSMITVSEGSVGSSAVLESVVAVEEDRRDFWTTGTIDSSPSALEKGEMMATR